MKTERQEISIRELVKGYLDTEESGVQAFSGKLDIRPAYQREFIYDDTKMQLVIDSILKGRPLNLMYWAVRDDGTYEVMDGQQRTISICKFVESYFSYGNRYFHNLQDDERNAILDYKLDVYFCSGIPSEKLEWFRTINIAGASLTDQELKNAVYAGTWLTDAKRFFSKNNCPAYGLGNAYLTGTPIRQDYLETVLQWISKNDIEGYMAKNQNESSASALWLYFKFVIAWVQAVFPVYRKEMKGVAWGDLYGQFKDKDFDPKVLEAEVSRLMQDEDVTKKKGIYQYVLDRKEKHLNIRNFSPNQKREAYESQEGICSVCNQNFDIEGMEADHITPWHTGGKTDSENCQMLCQECNRRKSGV